MRTMYSLRFLDRDFSGSPGHTTGSRDPSEIGRVLRHGLRWSALVLPLLLSACQTGGGRDTIAKLRTMQIEIKEEKIEGGFEKAMEGYQRFLRETPDSALSPEAIRRLADLKIEKEYGELSGDAAAASSSDRAARPAAAPAAVSAVRPQIPAANESRTPQAPGPGGSAVRTPRSAPAHQSARPAAGGEEPLATEPSGTDDLQRADTLEAIELYKKLLDKYPGYERNDQVLYQLSRAYEELGRVEDAMLVMNRMVREYPKSRYMDEVQFRRAEYFFTRRKYLDAEEAYASIVQMGPTSTYFELALYKLGWTFYKQELYDEALDRFIALLDYKVSVGYDFAQTADKAERQQIDDTFRVVSLGFSNLGGASALVDYFGKHGMRSYEDSVYSNLAEFYFDKRRYSDAVAIYNGFVSRNPFHRLSPQFQMRVIEIQMAGAFPSLVIEAKKQFVKTYGLKAEYWRHFEPAARPEVLGWLKTNISDLAKHYHALYQSPQQAKDKKTNFEEAMHWYREFLTSFPSDPDSPAVNYLLADLLLENGSFDLAAAEYEKTAYGYPRNEKSSQAGYSAVYAYRQQLAVAAPETKDQVKRKVVDSSLRFAETYPEHQKAPIVLEAAADDLYGMKEYEQAAAAARKVIDTFPGADADIVRAAWLVVGHASYELTRYEEAEAAYGKVLALLPAGDKSRDARLDNLAAAIYKQGEQARDRHDYRAAAGHFLRVGRMAPTSKIRVNAEYDAAAALIELKDWKAAAAVLTGFREKFPGNELQPQVTEKMAFIYREDGQLALAADEYERIETESRDEAVRREALLTAAELHQKVGNQARSLAIYRRYVQYFPHPVEPNLETRTRIAEIVKKNNDDRNAYLAELQQIVAIDAGAGDERTPKTRLLAGRAALVLAAQAFDQFAAVKLVEPFKANLSRKKELMRSATREFDKLLDYEDGEATAGATFYLAEIYADFSRDLKESERPTGLSPLEREEYDLAIEDQAYPFEEKAIATHTKNLELISRGIYNEWIDKSLQKLAKFIPARYDKPEEESPVMASLDKYTFAVERPKPDGTGQAEQTAAPKLDAKPEDATEAEKTAEPIPVSQPSGTNAVKTAEPKQDLGAAASEEAAHVTEPKQHKPAGTKKSAKASKRKKLAKPADARKTAKAEQKNIGRE